VTVDPTSFQYAKKYLSAGQDLAKMHFNNSDKHRKINEDIFRRLLYSANVDGIVYNV
jgi:hypothetical protein